MIRPDKQWQLREAVPGDSQMLSLIGAATFLDTFAGILDGEAIVAHCEAQHSADCYERYLVSGGRAWLALSDKGGAPIGFALTASPDIPGACDGDVELKRIYALSRFHGSGLGSDLMGAVLDAHKECQRVILGVYAKNTRAISFYRKQGFDPITTRQFNIGGTLYDDCVLARSVNPAKIKVPE